jgi:hypothetical protein
MEQAAVRSPESAAAPRAIVSDGLERVAATRGLRRPSIADYLAVIETIERKLDGA